MKRARESYANLTMEEAASRISRYMLTSAGALSRMEASPDEPTSQRRRQLATIALVLYGIDPAPFGLGREDLPPAIYAQLRRRRPRFACLTVDELRPWLVTAAA
jgi:hypothetical protein